MNLGRVIFKMKEKILVRSKILISEGSYDKALELLNESLNKFKDDSGILTQLSIVYELLEDFEKSKAMLEKALISDPDYPRAHYIRGVDCQNEGELEQAEKEFQIAIDNYPNYEDSFRNEHISEAHLNLGTVYYIIGKHEDAIKEWRLALTYDKNNQEARKNLAEFSDKPIEIAETGKDCEYLIDRGVSLSEEGRLIEAIRVLEKAYSKNPDHPLVHYNIGLVYGKYGDFDKAGFHLEKFIELAPNHKEVNKIKELVKKIKRGDFEKKK